ncbi:MAG: LAGLIDADG family homing endonuclease [Candidatus Diapherotrites archaeon]
MNEIVSPEERPEAIKAFFERIQSAAESIRKLEKAVVCTHHDCDGLTSGGIITKALQRENIPVHTITLKQLYSDDVERLKKMDASIIFTDFGSSYITLLQKELSNPFFIIDHHQRGDGVNEGHINPMEFGLNGGVELSSAGIAYFVAKEMSTRNKDLAALGIVGAVGDMQDSRGNGLVGLNRDVIKQGKEAGVLDVKTDLRLYGRISRPLIQYLTFSTSPVLPELTANPDNCARFLEGLGIDLKDNNGNWRAYEDLPMNEKKVLSTGLLMHLHEHNTPEWKMNEMIGDVYTLLHEEKKSPLRDAKEFSTVLNACVVHGTEVYLNGKPSEIQEIENERVFSVENGKIIPDRVVAKHEIPLPKGMNIFQITTKTGRNVSVTQNHEIMSLSSGNIKWVSAESLKKNDFVAISKVIPDVSRRMQFWDFFEKDEFAIVNGTVRVPNSRKFMKIPSFDNDLGFLIGYIAGDGHVKKNNSGVDIAFSKKPRDLFSFEQIKKIFSEKFQIKGYYSTDHSNCFNAFWHSTTFSTFIQRMGIPKGNKSSVVCFNPLLLEAEKSVVAGMLRGLFSSDGNIYSGGIEFATHSEKMINQMVYLLQRFGIISHVTHRKCSDCTGNKYRLLICGKINIQTFVKEIGFSLKEINDLLLSRTEKMNPINSRELFLPVREKIIRLWELLGVPSAWAAHFTYYQKGKQPSIESVRKYLDYFMERVKKCERAILTKNFQQLPRSLRFSRIKIAKSCGISPAWLIKIEKGRIPGKNAQKKIEKGFIAYTKLVTESNRIINDLQQFVDSDIYWDKVKDIHQIQNKPDFVYDITVERNHNYIANGIVVHNCGRNGASEIGFHVCTGDRLEYYERALALLREHRRNLAEGIHLMQTEGLDEHPNFYFFDAGTRIKDSIVGIVAGMLYGSGGVQTNKPIVAFSRHEDGSIKVSARATSELVRNGVNLGAALKETCKSLGKTAEGGGHRIAAGCRIEEDQSTDFLKAFDRILEEQQSITRTYPKNNH